MRNNRRKSAPIKSPVYEAEGNRALMRAYSKKGKEVAAYIDESDIGRLKDKGQWYAQWNTDNYDILLRTDVNGFPIKLPLAAFILGVGHNAPVHHKNGDLLDFRKDNLAIFEKKDRNVYKFKESHAVELDLLDRYGRFEAAVLLDDEDAARLQQTDLIWTVQKKSSGQPLVTAQTEDGPMPLHRFLTDCPDDSYVHFINKNPLDCRQKNMEVKVIE